ncbi:MAG: sugar phosphate isomerase/epimerase [Clostridiales bacterium]|nr:sugar phosphate isomerase/epimerase [Clostridiales bacterium]
MTNFESLVCFGFSPSMLFPKSFEDPLTHFSAIKLCCRCPGYETFETFLPENDLLRKACIREMKTYGKQLRYNTTGDFQVDGPYNPCSDNPEYRKQALDLVKMHIEFAAEAESPFIVVTGCPDKGEERRPELKKLYMEYFLQIAEYCRQYNMDILIEPIERHRFKKLLLGPTEECASFILDAQKAGAHNAHLMMDTAHLPLMGETIDHALKVSLPAGLLHVHMGDAVLNESSTFYGHTHPPVGVQGGLFDLDELTRQFIEMFNHGYIPKKPGRKRASISLEVKPYPGCSEITSIQLMYEKVKSACDSAAEQLGIY